MQIRSDDIVIHAFTPSDGSESAAIKIVHRKSGKEIVNDSTASKRDNFRHAMLDLVQAINPSPNEITTPELILYDEVRVRLPQTFHDGKVTDLTWDYTSLEWRYFVECSESKVTNWYVMADLQLRDE